MSPTDPDDPADWPAPYAERPLDAVVALPGSKSLTNRYLLVAALAGERSRLRAPLRSRDTLLMAQGLRALGAGVEDLVTDERIAKGQVANGPVAKGQVANGPVAKGQVGVGRVADASHRGVDADWIVEPATLTGPRSGVSIDCGLAGTVMRFLPPVAGLMDVPVTFDGDPHARNRPMVTGLDALRALSVVIDDQGRGALPFTVRGAGRVEGGEVTIDASSSSQFVSGLLLAGARFDRGLTVIHEGKPVPSLPHIAMTVNVLRDAGVVVDDDAPNRWRVEPGPLHALDVEVEPDLSNAAAFLAGAMVTGGTVHVPGWPQYTSQAGDGIRDIFDAMGGDVRMTREGLTVLGPDRPSGLDVDLHDIGELTPVVAAVAAVADSPSWLRGIAHLRGHETDRLEALRTEITRLGGTVEVFDDGLHIVPRPLHSGIFRTYADHRMAMAGAVLGLCVRGVVIEDIATTGKTMVDFAQRWSAMAGARAGLSVRADAPEHGRRP